MAHTFEAIELNLAPKPGEICPNKEIAEKFKDTRTKVTRDLAENYRRKSEDIILRAGEIGCVGCKVRSNGIATCTAKGVDAIVDLPGRASFAASADPETAAGFRMEFPVEEIRKAA